MRSSAARPAHAVPPRSNWVLFDEFLELWRRIDGRHRLQQLAVEAEDECFLRLAEPRRAFDEGIEHGLQVEGRAADDFEHVGGRGLLLQAIRVAR